MVDGSNITNTNTGGPEGQKGSMPVALGLGFTQSYERTGCPECHIPVPVAKRDILVATTLVSSGFTLYVFYISSIIPLSESATSR